MRDSYIVVIRADGRFCGFLGQFGGFGEYPLAWGNAGMFCNAYRFYAEEDLNKAIDTFGEEHPTWLGLSFHAMRTPDIAIDDYKQGQAFRDSLPLMV